MQATGMALVLAALLVVRRPRGDGDERNFRSHRLFAAAYGWFDRCSARLLNPLRQRLGDEAVGRVLEIGAGTGGNFPFYRPGTELAAVEPDRFMLRRARRRADEVALDASFHQVVAESLPFPDASFDTVVSALVLCSVADPARVLREVRRVLRPGGKFVFLEHVRAPAGPTARAQDALTPLWRRCAGNCHLNRRTAQEIAAAGLHVDWVEERSLPLAHVIFGVAR